MSRAPDLVPLSLPTLMERLDRTLTEGAEVFGLPRAALWRPDPRFDLSTTHFGARIGTPVGPAAGPHTQLAQNLLVAWLAGGRFMELKTVQVLDELEIPRPCIHVPHVGYNVEWSQELRVPESALEYAKGWVLIHEAARRRALPVDTIFDLSVGYDLAGIQGEKVAGFLRLMADASPLLDAIGAADDVPRQLSRTLTLSTFHGCPAHEIEAISTHLMRAHHLDVVVKLNPTLLGEAEVRRILHDVLGYHHIAVDPASFEHDLRWAQLMDMLPRLRAVAAAEGVGFGVKFSNTLVCRSPDPPFAAGDMYLSGAPLHVLAATLAARFLDTTGGEVPVTFSAGVDAQNVVDVLRAGIQPVTSCTDLLKGKGYARLAGQVRAVEAALAQEGATRLADLAKVAPSNWAEAVAANPRHAHAQNRVAPKKVGSALELLDCLTCDKCVPVCPNLAIQTLELPVGTVPGGQIRLHGEHFAVEDGAPLVVRRRHQILIVADLCNACGQCDPTCPEDGGPYATKPNLFLDARAWAAHPERDGFTVDAGRLHWRRGARVDVWTETVDGARWEAPEGVVELSPAGVPLRAHGHGTLDLRDAALLSLTWRALPDTDGWRPFPGALS